MPHTREQCSTNCEFRFRCRLTGHRAMTPNCKLCDSYNTNARCSNCNFNSNQSPDCQFDLNNRQRRIRLDRPTF